MTRPGIESQSPGPLVNTLTINPTPILHEGYMIQGESLNELKDLSYNLIWLWGATLYRILGTNSLVESIPLQVYNWFEFRFPFSRLVPIPRLKCLVCSIYP